MARKGEKNSISKFKNCKNMKDEIFYYESQGLPFQTNNLTIHPSFILMLVETSQEGYHIIDNKKYPLKGWQLHYLFSNQTHQWKLGDNTQIYQIIINNDNFDLIKLALRFNQSFYQKNAVIDLTKAHFEYLLYEFKEIEKELNSNFTLYEMICSRVRIILQKASKIIEDQTPNINMYFSSNIIYNFLDLIDIYYKEEKELIFYAEKLNITPNYLGILSRKYLNQSGNKTIKAKLLLEAKRRLLTPDLSIKEITLELGFKEQAHFANFFKSATGKSPSEFREYNT